MSRRVVFGSVSAAGALALVAALTTGAVAAPAPVPSVVPIEDTPAQTVTLDLVGDTWVSNVQTSQSASPELRVGSPNLGLVKSRSYLDFDYAALDAIPAGSVVSSAELTLSNFSAGSCTGSAIRVSRITGAWTLDGLKWNGQPAVTSSGSASSLEAHGAAACPDEAPVSFDVKGIVNSWLAGTARRGVQVKAAQESAKAGYRLYRSAENGDDAKAATLTVTYNAAPSTPADLTVAPMLGLDGLVSSLTPTFSAELTDPDGGPVHGELEVRKGTTALSPVVWTGSTDPVESGEVASVTMPGDVLLDGAIYTVSVYAHDGALRSKARAAKAFKVDVSAPGVTITSDVFTDGEWNETTPESAELTFDGSPDVAGFHLVLNGEPLDDAGADSSGDRTTTLTPAPGWHVIEVTPVDYAGNEGETETFSFGSGAPTFLMPSQWQGSTGDFQVLVDAPADSTGATLEWRVWGAEGWETAAEVDRDETAWDGSVLTDGGHSSTGLLTWHAALEAPESPRPLALQVRVCFDYAEAEPLCTEERFVVLASEE